MIHDPNFWKGLIVGIALVIVIGGVFIGKALLGARFIG